MNKANLIEKHRKIKRVPLIVVVLFFILIAVIIDVLLINRIGISNLFLKMSTSEKEISSSDVVEKYGNLQVIGKQLSSEKKEPVQLKGLSSHGLQWFPFIRGETLKNSIDYFNINVVRIAMYVEAFKDGEFWNGYIAQPEYMEAKANMMIQEAVDEGVYVILSWHIHNDPMNFKEEAMDFFERMSKKWGDSPNVLFEIANEPEGDIEWSRIKDYAVGDPENLEDGVIDIIRKYDSDDNPNIILVGTPFWSQRVNKASANPITEYSNIMYSLHFYAADHKEDIRAQAQKALDAGLPIFVTEWGTCNYGVDGPMDLESSIAWMKWVNKNNLSWINWALSNKDEKSSILKPSASLEGPWDESDLTSSGKFVKELF